MLSLSDNNQVGDIAQFKISYDLLNIDNHYFEQMISQIYQTELQLNRGNTIKKIYGENKKIIF